MTPAQFQIQFGPKLKEFIESDCGKHFFNQMTGLRPLHPDDNKTGDVLVRVYAKIEGYELCLRSMLTLANPPKIVVPPPQNYGIPDVKEEEKK